MFHPTHSPAHPPARPPGVLTAQSVAVLQSVLENALFPHFVFTKAVLPLLSESSSMLFITGSAGERCFTPDASLITVVASGVYGLVSAAQAEVRDKKTRVNEMRISALIARHGGEAWSRPGQGGTAMCVGHSTTPLHPVYPFARCSGQRQLPPQGGGSGGGHAAGRARRRAHHRGAGPARRDRPHRRQLSAPRRPAGAVTRVIPGRVWGS